MLALPSLPPLSPPSPSFTMYSSQSHLGTCIPGSKSGSVVCALSSIRRARLRFRDERREIERARVGERVRFSLEATETRIRVISSWVGEEILERAGQRAERVVRKEGGGK